MSARDNSAHFLALSDISRAPGCRKPAQSCAGSAAFPKKRLPLPATLTELSLENTRIGDRGVELLGQQDLPRLTRLILYGSQTTDASIPALQGMPQLTSITLGATRVTPTGLAPTPNRRQHWAPSPDPDGRP